jgi:hypothetical protein
MTCETPDWNFSRTSGRKDDFPPASRDSDVTKAANGGKFAKLSRFTGRKP